MILKARIIKGSAPKTRAPELARRVPADVVAARAEAERIVEAARRAAEELTREARESAAREAREAEVARLAAQFLAVRIEDDRRLERDADRLVELAVVLAERLVGEALRVDPSRIAALASAAIGEARGARRVRIDASPDDVPALAEAVGAAAEVQADANLERGSLIVHTDLGRVDARLAPQLARLAPALREALR